MRPHFFRVRNMPAIFVSFVSLHKTKNLLNILFQRFVVYLWINTISPVSLHFFFFVGESSTSTATTLASQELTGPKVI